jgi:DNA-binding NarL/FixJ family response regulator
MGITAREQQIISAWEGGRKAPDIADELELDVEYVRQRINWLCNGLGPDRHHEAAMEDGSRRLLVAIEQARAA